MSACTIDGCDLAHAADAPVTLDVKTVSSHTRLTGLRHTMYKTVMGRVGDLTDMHHALLYDRQLIMSMFNVHAQRWTRYARYDMDY